MIVTIGHIISGSLHRSLSPSVNRDTLSAYCIRAPRDPTVCQTDGLPGALSQRSAELHYETCHVTRPLIGLSPCWTGTLEAEIFVFFISSRWHTALLKKYLLNK